MPKFCILIILSVLLQIALAFGYIYCIAPGNNFPNPPVDYYILFLPVVLSTLPVVLLPKKFERPGDVILWYLYVVCILPYGVLTVLLAQDETLRTGVYALVLPFMALAACCRLTPQIKLRLDAPLDRRVVIPALGVLAAVATAFFWILFKPSISFDLYSVYDRRLDARETSGSGTLLSYSLAALSAFVAPVLISFGCFTRKYLLYGLAGIVALLFVFFYDGTKASLFLPLALITVGAATRLRAFSPIFLLASILLLALTASAAELLWDAAFLNEIVVRRVFVVPVYLFHSFIEFFSVRGFLFFSDVKGLSGLISSTRSDSASILVGEDYLGSAGLNANIGSISYGYAEMGILGGWLFAACIYFYILGMDAVRHRYSKTILFPLAFAVALRFSEQAFQTSLISGGLFFILLFLLMTKDEQPAVHQETKKSASSSAVAPGRNWLRMFGSSVRLDQGSGQGSSI